VEEANRAQPIRRESQMNKITYNGQDFNFDEIRQQMDPELVERIQDTTDTDQDFFDEYLLAHDTKYGSRFVIR
jgi:asparagine synthetase B (glutamine-hydrolysing)